MVMLTYQRCPRTQAPEGREGEHPRTDCAKRHPSSQLRWWGQASEVHRASALAAGAAQEGPKGKVIHYEHGAVVHRLDERPRVPDLRGLDACVCVCACVWVCVCVFPRFDSSTLVDGVDPHS